MSLPGFTASNSLPRSRRNYYSSSLPSGVGASRIEAQLWTLGPGTFPCCIDGVCGFSCHVGGPGADDPGGWGVNPGVGDVACRQCLARCSRVPTSRRPDCLDSCPC